MKAHKGGEEAHWKLYKNTTSGILSFIDGGSYIIIQFKTLGTYLYNTKKPGGIHVRQMIKLAHIGKGLATYINKYVRDNYAAKLN